MPWYIWFGLFLALLGIALGIVLPIYTQVTDHSEFSPKEVVLYWVYPILISLALAIITSAGTLLIFSGALSKCWKWLLAQVTLYTFSKALRLQNNPIHSTGIGERNGSVVLRLETGSNSGVVFGTRFRVTNTAAGEMWGVLQAIEVDDTWCICSVFNRSNPGFWEELERRVNMDASPPLGVTIRRDFPEEFMDMIRELLNGWGS